MEELRRAEDDIRSYTQLVIPTQALDVIKTDPSDNWILECAIAAQSNFIVSGDARHVLPVSSYAGISIVKVTDFIEWLNRS